MRPENLKTLIYLDGGNPDETRKIKDILGFLDGQTTNPSFVSKNPKARERLDQGKRFNTQELLDFYKALVEEISGLIPEGSVSIEVYADQTTGSGQMLDWARDMNAWIPNAHIKFPTTREGLEAAQQAVSEGMRVNMTLCFSQQQAAAVYAATRGSTRGQVYLSPFVGRLYDEGQNGMDLTRNILRMFEQGDGHVMLLTASVRDLDQLLESIRLGTDIVTCKFETLKEWADTKLTLPGSGFTYDPGDAAPIPYQELDLSRDWQSFDLGHFKTDEGMEKFSSDWNKLLKE